jgi:hypothetical protein
MKQSLFSLFIGLLISIIAMIYLFKIRSDTNNNIFQQIIEPSMKEKFFYSINTTPAVNPAEVSIKCELYQNAIMNPKLTKLGDLFDLNIEDIHSKANLLLLFAILAIISMLLTVFSLVLLEKIQSHFYICLIIILAFGIMVLGFSNLVLTILFFFSFYNGDTNKFVEFLSCKNVNRNEFSDYLFAEKLKKDFTIFVIFNIINSLINSKMNQNKNSNRQKPQRNGGQNEVVVKTI